MSPVWIVSQWYREEETFDLRLCQLWRAGLRRYAPDIPILVVHNGGATDPPYDDVTIIPAVDMKEHGRGSPGHYYNCWRSMCHGFETLRLWGVRTGLFIGQNLVVGAHFAEECDTALEGHDVLLNLGCLAPGLAFTEYLAARPEEARSLWQKRLPDDHFMMLEGQILTWTADLKLRVGPFPGLWKPRDEPLTETDTFCFHSQPEEREEFAQRRGLLPYIRLVV